MVVWPNLFEYKESLNIFIKRVIILECDKIATDALEVAPFLTRKEVVAHEAEGIAPALAQKPGLRPLVTRASNAWHEATWEAHDMPIRQQQRFAGRQVGSGSGLAKANSMGPSIVPSQRC